MVLTAAQANQVSTALSSVAGTHNRRFCPPLRLRLLFPRSAVALPAFSAKKKCDALQRPLLLLAARQRRATKTNPLLGGAACANNISSYVDDYTVLFSQLKFMGKV